jgi:hypothetical protein
VVGSVLTVVCVNHENYLGRGDEYVSKLQRGVARNLTVPHEFVCLTERELGTDLKGWWVKMKLGEPGRFTGPVMYLDLDVIVTANFDSLIGIAAAFPYLLWMRDDFSYSMVKPRKGLGPDALKLLGGPGCCNSSVMLWNGDAGWWDDWTANRQKYMTDMHGDQNAISHIMRGRIGFLPNESICSYKYQVRNGEKIAPIVVTHGVPKPHEMKDEFVRQHWS